MKSLKRFLSVLLAAVMLCACLAPAALAADDITGHWSEPYMREMSAHGVIFPNGSGSYTPGSVITRAEFMRYINRAFGFTQKADISAYTDVASSKWYYETVQIAVRYGYISGTGATTMGPDRPITREQVCAILGRLSKQEYPAVSASSLSFTDASSIASWCLPYVSALTEANVFVGDENNRFRPKASITRGEIARILYAYLGSQLDKNAVYTAAELRDDAPGATVTASCVLQDATIAGDLYISEGLSATSGVTLRNLSVLGSIVVAGGAVTLENVKCDSLLISSPFKTKLTVTATEGTEIEETRAATPATLAPASGATFGKVTGEASTGTPAKPSTPTAANAVSPDAAAFDRYAQSDRYGDLTFTLSPAGSATLHHLMIGEGALYQGTDYSYDSATGEVTIPAGQLAAQAAGSVTLTFVMSEGANPTAKLTIADSTPTAVLRPDQMVFSATATDPFHRDVTVWLELDEGVTVSQILAGKATLEAGTGYLIVEDRVVLFRETLAAQKPSDGNQLEISFLLSNGAAPTLKLSYI